MKRTKRIKQQYAKAAYVRLVAQRVVDQIKAKIFNALDKLYGLSEHQNQ